MLRLNLSRDPEWYEILPGVRILAEPATSAIMGSARHDMIGTADDASVEEVSIAFGKAVARRVIRDWEGIGDEDDKPLPVTPEHVDALLDHYRAFEGWQNEYMAKFLRLESEKNGSAPSPNGTSAGATPTARRARKPAQSARGAKTSRKR